MLFPEDLTLIACLQILTKSVRVLSDEFPPGAWLQGGAFARVQYVLQADNGKAAVVESKITAQSAKTSDFTAVIDMTNILVWSSGATGPKWDQWCCQHDATIWLPTEAVAILRAAK